MPSALRRRLTSASVRPVSFASRASVNHLLQAPHPRHVLRQAIGAHHLLVGDDLADARQEPRVIGGDLVDLRVAEAETHGMGDDPDAVRALLRQGLGQPLVDGLLPCRVGANEVAPETQLGAVLGDQHLGRRHALDLDLVEAGQVGLHRGQSLLHRFVEAAADGHGLADRLHGGR
jgi:hypothetical protein